MRRLLLSLLLSSLAAATAFAQKPKAPPKPEGEQAKLKEDLAQARAEVERLKAAFEALAAEVAAMKSGPASAPAGEDKLAASEAALAAAREEAAAAERRARRAERLARAEEGRALYRRQCAPCHGEDGAGEGPATDFLDQRPRDFTRGTYKFRSTPSGALPAAGDLARTILAGVPGTAMPGWRGDLSKTEVARLVAVLESFSPRFGEEEPAPPLPVPPRPEFTRELVAEGRVLYRVLGCAQCHGLTGRGDGPSRALKDEDGHVLLAADFTRGVYKSGKTPEDLYRTIATGLDGTPMPSYYESFGVSRQLILDMAGGLGEDAEAARAYAAAQPEEVAEGDPALDRRRWAVVAYLQSLAKRGFLRKLFGGQLRRYDPR
jgi:mono/diheme cytochrome c family protein